MLNQTGLIPPETDALSRRWWHELSLGTFTLATCGACRREWLSLTPGCPHCGSADVSLVPSKGVGRVYSWVVVNRALSPVFESDAPYTIVAADLDGGARVFGRLVPSDGVHAGMPVRVEIYVVDGQALFGFVPST